MNIPRQFRESRGESKDSKARPAVKRKLFGEILRQTRAAALHQLSRGAPRFAALAQLWRAAGVGLRGRLRDEVFARSGGGWRCWRSTEGFIRSQVDSAVLASTALLVASRGAKVVAQAAGQELMPRSLWDVGLVQELQRHIDEELAEALQADELIRFLQLVDHLALLRAVRPPMWRSFMFALLRSRDRWPQARCLMG
eukprot:Skav224563  [mRNA]  locus=scaffold4295:34794:40872:- [translate_table: standard]